MTAVVRRRPARDASLALLPFALDWRSPVLRQRPPVGARAASSSCPLADRRSSKSGCVAGRTGVAHGARASARPRSRSRFLRSVRRLCASRRRFRWTRHAGARTPIRSSLEALGRHVIVGYRDLAELQRLIERRAIAGVFLGGAQRAGQDGRRGPARHRRAAGHPAAAGPAAAVDRDRSGRRRGLAPVAAARPLGVAVRDRQRVIATQPSARPPCGSSRPHRAANWPDIGVNLNFAPVVDLNHRVVNPKDRLTRIHERAISADPQVVTEVADALLLGAAAGGRALHAQALSRSRPRVRRYPPARAPISDVGRSNWPRPTGCRSAR